VSDRRHDQPGFRYFEVPTGATGLRFVFDANAFGGGRITWTL
jgi:hypothetical protein